MDVAWVKSTNIRCVAHDGATETLEVEFHSGMTYRYSDVPRKVFTDLLKAPSVGTFFHQNVAREYDYEKIDKEPRKQLPVRGRAAVKVNKSHRVIFGTSVRKISE